MTNVLRDSIHQMAAAFASSVLKAIRGASLEDILSETRDDGGNKPAARAAVPTGARRSVGRPRATAAAPPPARREVAPRPAPARLGRNGRLGRRSATDIAGVIQRIVQLLERNASGLRAEQIRAALSLEAKEMPRPLTQALESRKISKVGEKRATTYFAGSAKTRGPAASAPASPRGSKEATKRSSASKKTARATAVPVGKPAAKAAPVRRGPGRPRKV